MQKLKVFLLSLFFFLITLDLNAEVTFEIRLVEVLNDGVNLTIGVELKGMDLPIPDYPPGNTIPKATLHQIRIDIIFDPDLLTFTGASNWAVQNIPDGYYCVASLLSSSIYVEMHGWGVNNNMFMELPGEPPGFDVEQTFKRLVELNFTHSNPDIYTNITIFDGSPYIELFQDYQNVPYTNNVYLYEMYSITCIGLLNHPLPVELIYFTANSNRNSVTLNWETATEVGNYGFEIERAFSPVIIANDLISNEVKEWEIIGFVEGSGNSNSPKEYTFKDNSSFLSGKVLYRLKQIDNDGQYEYSNEVEVEIISDKFELYQNYPNPFNPLTTISFHLAEGGKMTLKIYDALGKEIATLVDEEKPAGTFEITWNAEKLSSGIYYYQLKKESFIRANKMLLIK